MPSMAALSQVHQELMACSSSSWYPLLQQYAFRSVVITLPAAFVAYLEEDGVYLPEDSPAIPKRGPAGNYADEEEYQAWTEGEAGGSGEGSDDEGPPPWPVRFPELHQQMQEAIQELGGSVVPKLNWSCPKDAVWLNSSSSLACSNAEEVALMLKASDRVGHDLQLLRDMAGGAAPQPAPSQPLAGQAPGPSSSQQPEQQPHEGQHRGAAAGGIASSSGWPVPVGAATLMLRRWQALRPEREFRCFVHAGRLVAISQRDPSQFFPQLQGEVDAMAAALQAFHDHHVAPTFPLQHYTFDAYVATSDAVKVIDFNPVGGTTSPLLFSWQELGWAQGLAEPRENGAAAEAALAAHGGGASGADGLEDQLGGRQQEVNGHRQQVGQGAAVPLVRIVDGPHSIQPGERSACAMPFDMLMLGSHGAGDAAAAQEMISFMQRRP